MKKLDAISVRLDSDTKDRLETLAKATRLDKTTLIRLAVTSLVEEAERHDGKLVIPPNFGLKTVPRRSASKK